MPKKKKKVVRPKAHAITTTAQTEIVDRKSLSLEEIEQKMIEIATDNTDDIIKAMINEKKICMLEKVANFKIKMIQLKAMEQQNVINAVEPLTVKFISSKTQDQQSRLERIDKEIVEQGMVRKDA